MPRLNLYVKKRKVNGKTRLYYNVRYTLQGAGRISESLGIYLFENPTTTEERQHNATHKPRIERKKADLQVKIDRKSGNFISKRQREKANLLQLFFEFIERCSEVGVSDGTRMNYGQCKRHLQALYGDPIPLSKLTPDFIRRFQNDLETKTGLRHNTVARHINTLSIVIRWMIKEGYLDSNPFDKLDRHMRKYPSYDRRVNPSLRPKTVLSLNELKACWDSQPALAPQDDKDRVLMWLFGTMTGLRFSDLTALTPLHIKSIETSQGYRNYVEVIQRKTALMVQVPLNATAERILEMVKLRNPDWDYKFFRVTTNGANLDRLAVAAGLFTSVGEYKHITMNTSRHTFSMLLQNSGARPLYVDTLLGHALNSTDLLRANYTVDSFEESPEVYFRLVDAINFLPDTYEGKTDGFLY